MKLLKLLRLDFLPRSTSAGLLVLRLWFGLSILLLHGWGKFTRFSEMSPRFLDPFGFGSPASLALVVFAEIVCSLLVALGLFTRLAAGILMIDMATAFLLAHKATLGGAKSGELAFVYFAAWAALFIAGAGRFSLDAKLGGRTGR